MPRLFVNNFRFDETEEGIVDFFRDYGHVSRVSIVKDHDTGRSRGFGFVDIDPLPQFADIVEETNGMRLNGRPLNVELAREKQKGNGGSPAKSPKKQRRQRRERDGEDWD